MVTKTLVTKTLQAEGVSRSVKRFLFLSLVAVVVVVTLDTLFHISNRSYFANLDFWGKLAVYLNSISLLLLPVAVLAVAFRLSGPFLFRFIDQIASAGMLAFWAVLVSTGFVHMDAWIYSLFRVNVTDINNILRLALFAVIVLLCFWLSRNQKNVLEELFNRVSRFVVPLCVALLSVLLISTLLNFRTVKAAINGLPSVSRASGNLPDIVIFSSDGISADHMNLYGYERKTTKYLNLFAQDSTVYTNAYSNCSHSRCSNVSTITGKPAIETKVMYDPDILVRRDSFEHLPAILSRLGYYNVYLGEGYHSLPSNFNLRHAFHEQNGIPTGFRSRTMAGDLLSHESYFLVKLIKLYKDKLGYIAGLDENYSMFETLGAAYDEAHYKIDEDNIVYLLDLLKTDKRPLFAYIHLGGTHGPRFIQDIERFSKGKAQDKDWDIDFYDDAILAQDYLFGLTMGELIRTKRYDNSLILFKTDHGMIWNISEPLPLLVHLPGRDEDRVISSTVDYMDIAPSILEYLGVDVPGFMGGRNIFDGFPSDGPDDRIVMGAVTELALENDHVVKPSSGPPYYGVKRILATDKEYQMRFDLREGKAVLYRQTDSGFVKHLGDPATFGKFYVKVTSTLRGNGLPVQSASPSN